MEFKIKKTNNGYVITDYVWEDTDENQNKIIREEEEVLQTDTLSNNEEIVQVLFKVAELLGYTCDKYGAENLEIGFHGKGHKLE